MIPKTIGLQDTEKKRKSNGLQYTMIFNRSEVSDLIVFKNYITSPGKFTTFSYFSSSFSVIDWIQDIVNFKSNIEYKHILKENGLSGIVKYLVST